MQDYLQDHRFPFFFLSFTLLNDTLGLFIFADYKKKKAACEL